MSVLSSLSNLFGGGDDSGPFIDCGPGGTGEVVHGAYIGCGDCGANIFEGDVNCSGCGKTIDQEKNAHFWEEGRQGDEETRRKFGQT